jgi:DNA-binding HxlR family transcriptional regulator
MSTRLTNSRPPTASAISHRVHRGSRQPAIADRLASGARGKPLMALLSRRWTLRILWELRTPAFCFRELQERCDEVSTVLLSQRVTELRRANLIEPGEFGGYLLTRKGRQLIAALRPLNQWANNWEAALYLS